MPKHRFVRHFFAALHAMLVVHHRVVVTALACPAVCRFQLSFYFRHFRLRYDDKIVYRTPDVDGAPVTVEKHCGT